MTKKDRGLMQALNMRTTLTVLPLPDIVAARSFYPMSFSLYCLVSGKVTEALCIFPQTTNATGTVMHVSTNDQSRD